MFNATLAMAMVGHSQAAVTKQREVKSLNCIKMAFTFRRKSDVIPKVISEDISVATSGAGHIYHGMITNVQPTILRYFVDEFSCSTAAILNIITEDEFKAYCLSPNKGIPPPSKDIKYETKTFTGLLETWNAKPQIPTIFNKNCEPWKQLFEFVPAVIILVPTTLASPRRNSDEAASKISSNPNVIPPSSRASPAISISTITVLAFKTATLPTIFVQQLTWQQLIDACQLKAPILVNVDRYEDKMGDAKTLDSVMDSALHLQTHIQDIGSCVKTLGLKFHNLFDPTHTVIYVLHQDGDEPLQLNKYETFGAVKDKPDERCPDRDCHSQSEFVQSLSIPVGWTAQKQKCIRINDSYNMKSECGIQFQGPLHSFGSCLAKNMMCIHIKDYTNDMSLVIEMTDKQGGFTEVDENNAKLLSNMSGDIISSSVMLEHRRNAIRRCDITNRIINNITKVHFTKVKKLLDFKFQESVYFSKRFYTLKFTFNQLSKEQYAGVILFIFSELGFFTRWKMRKSTMVRFILSLRQGYIENPYHNWKHACTVTHFAFYFLKKMQLQKHGYLTELEAFAFITACLCHDMGHRGLNNHFGMFADKESNHLCSQETSLAERHHAALALQLLSSEECNIIENLTDKEYTEFIELLQWNIIATDIGKHLIERDQNFLILKKFAKKKMEHRRALLSLLMTACDLSESIKQWDDYIVTVRNIFFEFFEQGDEELRLGHVPTPIMDKRIAYIPYIEMKFMDEIVRPVFDAISHLLPAAEEAVFKIDYFKELWLVATKVFDENVLVRNPLEVLGNPSMLEEYLKGEVNVELEKEAINIRHMVSDMTSLTYLETISTSLRDSLLERKKCWRKMKKFQGLCRDFCCCKRCRQTALHHAGYVREMCQESKFMEIRSDQYMKIRVEQYFPGEFPDEHDPRARIQSLLNPIGEKAQPQPQAPVQPGGSKTIIQ